MFMIYIYDIQTFVFENAFYSQEVQVLKKYLNVCILLNTHFKSNNIWPLI